MAVDINYWWVALIAVGAVAFIVWQIMRDHKDKKKLQKEIIESELKPEKNDDPID
jgi:hypothetical protein